MSESLEKVRGIEHLAQFPLPLVLLPNEILPLHIFEPRYREMVSDARSSSNLFGVAYFEPVDELIQRPPIGSIGCVAEIRDVQMMPDGRSNIVTSGLIRYRILDYVDRGNPYLEAEAEFFEDDTENTERQMEIADEVFTLFERIAKAAFKISGNRGEFPEIQRAEPEALSFLVTAAFSFDNALKYEMLEMTSTSGRLERLRSLLLQAVGQMEENAEITAVAKTNGHSKKKLDI
ncbi:MAG: LON peptidase substrate-binding domain-containing protein [Pyrinomonadaceae bacterium]|nr:LON peptidase substrate-binding domain-containing protein [Pyrinomonadaceae bacterium]